MQDKFDNALGQRIKAARRARGLTLHDLGATIGVTYQQVQKYETGFNRVSAATLWRIGRALDAPINYFYADVGDAEEPEILRTAFSLARMDLPVRNLCCQLIEALQTPSSNAKLSARTTSRRSLEEIT